MITEFSQSEKEIVFPKEFGNYIYEMTIGKGATSIVGKVTHKSTRKPFAVKIVSRDDLVEKGLFLSFEQELRVHQSLDHPNIVKIYDVIYSEKNIYVIMDLCQNGDLFDWIQKGILSGSENLKRILYQILSAVDYIHKRNIAHLDLKPENILIDDNLSPKITDFGCCETPIRKNTKEFYGTLFYTAPEILKSTVVDFCKCDIWSLGVIFYALATCDLPWDCTNDDTIRKCILAGHFSVPSYVDKKISIIIYGCLRKNPSQRLTAEELLKNELFNEVDRKKEILRRSGRLAAACSMNFSTSRINTIIPARIPVSRSRGNLAAFIKPTISKPQVTFVPNALVPSRSESQISKLLL